jgi:hypothetical protein
MAHAHIRCQPQAGPAQLLHPSPTCSSAGTCPAAAAATSSSSGSDTSTLVARAMLSMLSSVSLVAKNSLTATDMAICRATAAAGARQDVAQPTSATRTQLATACAAACCKPPPAHELRATRALGQHMLTCPAQARTASCPHPSSMQASCPRACTHSAAFHSTLLPPSLPHLQLVHVHVEDGCGVADLHALAVGHKHEVQQVLGGVHTAVALVTGLVGHKALQWGDGKSGGGSSRWGR